MMKKIVSPLNKVQKFTFCEGNPMGWRLQESGRLLYLKEG